MVLAMMFAISADVLAQGPRRGEETVHRQANVAKAPAPTRVETDRKFVGTISRNDARYKKETTKVVATRKSPAKAQKIIYNNRAYNYSDGRYYVEMNGKYIQAPPPRGLRVKMLPANFVSVNYGNNFFYYFEGVFYTNYRNGNYEVVYPPVGTIVDAIPADYEKVIYNGISYYEYNGILYQKIKTNFGKGYQVVGFIDF